MPDDSFLERWENAIEQLRREHSLDGLLKMHENGEVSWVELFQFAYQHWHDYPGSSNRFLSGLANHQSSVIREVAEYLSDFIAKQH